MKSHTLQGNQIANGIKLDLSGLPNDQKIQLLKFIGRVSETSYRRGLQQGQVFEKSKQFHQDPYDLRYCKNLDEAYDGETGAFFRGSRDALNSVVERVMIEHDVALDQVGLTVP